MLVELGLVEQPYRAVLEVLDGAASVTDVARRYGRRERRLGAGLAGTVGPHRTRRGLEGDLQAVNPRRIAKVLLAESPRAGVVELLVDDLTAGSLQSASELYRVAGYLGLEKGQFGVADSDLREVFECRNRLIHELDIDFSQPNRNRFPRRREDMVKYAWALLTVSKTILAGVDRQL